MAYAHLLYALNHLLGSGREGDAIGTIHFSSHCQSLLFHTHVIVIGQLKRLTWMFIYGLHHQLCQFLCPTTSFIESIVDSKRHSHLLAMVSAEFYFLIGICGKTVEADQYTLPEAL